MKLKFNKDQVRWELYHKDTLMRVLNEEDMKAVELWLAWEEEIDRRFKDAE